MKNQMLFLQWMNAEEQLRSHGSYSRFMLVSQRTIQSTDYDDVMIIVISINIILEGKTLLKNLSILEFLDKLAI